MSVDLLSASDSLNTSRSPTLDNVLERAGLPALAERRQVVRQVDLVLALLDGSHHGGQVFRVQVCALA